MGVRASLAKRLGTKDAWNVYRSKRNQAVSALRRTKREYFASLSRNVRDLKQFWSAYHSITRDYKRVPPTLFKGPMSATSPVAKATLLNDHFVSCFTPANVHPPRPAEANDDPSTLSDLQCSGMEVSKIISALRSDIASGPDGISIKMLKDCATSICSPLATLFNKSLDVGKVPTDWKVSNITPIFKAGDITLASNYRPISLLSLVSKILERIVHNALLSHLLHNDMLPANQFGFRPSSSTQEAILSMTRDWHNTLEEGDSVGCVFFDLSKAFDTLPHNYVLESLIRVGVMGSLFDWFVDYLKDRKQRVVLEGVSSPLQDVISGVPQGSILGPLLFIISVDPLTRLSVSNETRLGMFADDIVL